jgi:hypothetical protein
MTDLETRLRNELVRRAGIPTATMPGGTLGRVRRRQAIFVTVAASLAIVLATSGIGLLRTSPSDVGSGSEPLQPPTSPLERVPEGWPSVDVLDPSGAYPPPAADVDAVDGVRVLATGTVEGYGFSFLAWTGSGDPADDAPNGPCVLFVGPSPTSSNRGGGGPISSTCGHAWDPPIPEGADLIVTSQQDAAAEGVGATFGFVSERVSDLVVSMGDGTSRSIPILRGPAGWEGVRAFLVFAPADRSGVLSALASDGTLLARGSTCRFRPGAGGACTVEAEQVAPIPAR